MRLILDIRNLLQKLYKRTTFQKIGRTYPKLTFSHEDTLAEFF